ncbi:MAG TPA: hypothetical protein V6C69_20260, partial [Trichormus sp.]
DLASLSKDGTTSSHKAIPPSLNLRRKKGNETVSIGKKARLALIAAPFVVAAATGTIVYTLCKPAADNTRIAAVPQSPAEAEPPPPDLPGDGAGKFSGSEQPFSRVERRAGKDVRIFNFGDAHFGRLSLVPAYTDYNLPRAETRLRPAPGGDFVVPLEGRIKLTVDLSTFLQHPYWINRFGKNDFASLRLESTSDNTAFSADTERINYDEVMSFLSNLNSLEELDLAEVPISMFGLKQMHIERFSRLRVLDIGTTNIDGRDLAQMPQLLMQLQSLQINDMRHASKVLAVMQHSTQIDTLMAESTDLADSDMDYISGMQNLRVLSLTRNNVTDRGLEKLIGLKHLAYIWLPANKITPSAVPILAKFTHLKGIRVPVTFTGHESELRAALPKDCLVKYFK